MVQFLSIFFLGFLQFLLGFSKVPIFLCHPVLVNIMVLVLRFQCGVLNQIFHTVTAVGGLVIIVKYSAVSIKAISYSLFTS